MQTKIELTITHESELSNVKIREIVIETLTDRLGFIDGMQEIHASMAGYAGESADLE